MGHLGVVSNAAFAVNRDSNCECHQFLCFCVEGFGCRCRSQKRAKGLRHIWRALPQQADPAYHIVGDLRIVLAHMMLPSIDDMSELKVGSAARIDKYQDTRTASMRVDFFRANSKASRVALSPSDRQRHVAKVTSSHLSTISGCCTSGTT